MQSISNLKIVRIRNSLISFGYRFLLKPVLFQIDPEKVHDRFVNFGNFIGSYSVTRKLTAAILGFRNPILEQTVAGIRFPNPIGLSAGFDKEGKLTSIIPSVGFGFMEVGSVTGLPCRGNKKPRLWRLPKSKSLVVNYGLKSEGSKIVASRLQGKKFSFPVGISIAKANTSETDDIDEGIKDYQKATYEFIDIGDFFVINISCPNTSGGEPFVQDVNLKRLLLVLNPLLANKPTFIKLPADIDEGTIVRIINVVNLFSITGFICTNLTRVRQDSKILDKLIPPHGGLSGKIVEDRSNEVLRFVRKTCGEDYLLIGTGGIFTAEDAYRKIKLGASLVEMITGMIFKGPQVISEITSGLTELLRNDGFKSVSDAVGVDVD